jgi:hypothetical protein
MRLGYNTKERNRDLQPPYVGKKEKLRTTKLPFFEGSKLPFMKLAFISL